MFEYKEDIPEDERLENIARDIRMIAFSASYPGRHKQIRDMLNQFVKDLSKYFREQRNGQ